MLATSILIASVLLLMQAACDVAAFVHGWQDGPDNRTDRHQWIPAGFYALGWRAKRGRLDVARRELEQRRALRDQTFAMLDAEVERLAAAMKAELHRKDQR